MFKEAWTLLTTRGDFFGKLLLEHIEISLAVVLIAIVFGGIAGILISQYDKAAKPTLGVINFLYTIPSISMLGLLIPFSGIGNGTAVIALTIYALLPMVRNTYTGMINVDPAILEAAEGMGSTPAQMLFRIQLPLAMPVIFSGIRNMVTMTIALAGIASFIGAGGLGVAIYRGITTNNAAMTFVGSILIALFALLVDFLLGVMEKRMKKRGKKAKRQNKVMAFTALALIAGLVFGVVAPRGGRKVVHIATKPMTEQYILGEMLKAVIEEETDLKVDLTQGVGGGTSNIQPAMESGEFDLYPEYTGTGWNQVLKLDSFYTEERFDELQKDYREKLNMTWDVMLGFNDTFGMIVRRDIADRYDLKTYSDLEKLNGELVFGAQYDFFERRDGYEQLRDTYNLSFKSTKDMDMGLKYRAINSGKIDIMPINTTDGQLSQSDVVVLKDDKNMYPSYQCGIVVRQETLDKYPELHDALQTLDHILTEEDMQEMNYKLEVEKKEPRDVARAFLQEKGILN
ncbi:MAG: glycine betaine ABC transporter substrate-binding protein [Peptoniphilus sp.]|nr:glycine betaine ABC transporter substrate-binding protein [Peptoniphilus sp.]MDD7362672.1 glycine betaine ABC transporter substrate-binding protein [Bacillota bacterium]MDY6044929.1 glycine betaine ABC transporter substrate-binding protein [Peptoniphilus sp.]